jgi:DNA-directed RNA polymerase specialized sigma24 family protein
MIEGHDEPEEVTRHDVALLHVLQAAGCAGPAWDRLAVDLAEFGFSMVSTWLSTRIISQKCKEKGRGVTLPHDWTAEDREDLVTMTVSDGMEMLRQALLAGKWNPEKRASLRTYFLGSCLLAFPNVLRQWRNDRERYRRAATAYGLDMAARPQAVNPVDVVDALDALRSLTRNESKRDQAMRYLRFLDFTPTEIAYILGLTPTAVTTQLSRLNRRKRHDNGRRTP